MKTSNYFLSLLAALLFSAAQASATTIYVDAAAPVGGDGASWQSAFNDLRDALDNRQPGDEIRLAGGVYKPDRGSGDRFQSFPMLRGITVKGGYAGAFAATGNPDLRNLSVYVSVLSGDIGVEGDIEDNSFSVVTTSGGSGLLTLDGLTVTGGNADGTSNRSGGGGLNIGWSDLRVVDSVIIDNHADSGAGVALRSTTAVFENVQFSYNSAVSGGGAISIASSDNTSIINSTFLRNQAGSSGGAISSSALLLTVRGSRFQQNSADTSGGAVYLSSGDVLFDSSDFYSNTASSAFEFYGGGAIRMDAASVSIIRCSFVRNNATKRGGALNVPVGGLLSIVSSQLAENSARSGGAVSVGGLVTSVNSVFLGNSAVLSGGAIEVNSGTFNMHQGTTYANTARAGSGTVVHNNFGSATIYNSLIVPLNGVASRSANVFDGNSSATTTIVSTLVTPTGVSPESIFRDPIGADGIPGTADDDLRLIAGSIAIDGGTLAGVPMDLLDLDNDGNTSELLPLDKDGRARIVGAAPDLGAYEFDAGNPYADGGGQCLADQDGDGAVTVADYFGFLNNFFSELGSPQCGG